MNRRGFAAALTALLCSAVVGAVQLPVLVPGSSCPTSFAPINYQYLTTVQAGPNGAQPVLSSNWTMAPFSAPPIPIDSFKPATKTPTIPRVCDNRGRCIEVYELVASVTTLDMGFKDPLTNASVLSQFLTYDGSVPGPAFVIDQGVQTLVRLYNHINCNTTTMTPVTSTDGYYSFVTGLTLHQHGSASLSPFDGWTSDDIQACQWKDYVYPNQELLPALWYHDHSLGITAETVGCGLFGTYQVLPCNNSMVPQALQALAPAQYLVLTDQLFIQNEGSAFINPAMFYQVPLLSGVEFNNQTYDLTGLSGDHILVNGKPWPTVTVQRRPYWFILHNGAQTRVFNLVLVDPSTNSSVNQMQGRFWVVGAEGGLRLTPVQAPQGLIMGAGERYQVVIDFSQFPVGTELILTNPPTEIAMYPYFCYTSYVMKFMVDGTEPAQQPFNPVFFTNPYIHEDKVDSVEAACARALNGQADVIMQTINEVLPSGAAIKAFANMPGQTGSNAEPWQASMVGPGPSHDKKRRHLRGSVSAASVLERRGLQVIASNSGSGGGNQTMQPMLSEYLPHSVPTNGWSTWWMYNNVSGPGGGGIHPIHLHLVNFFICGRRNNVTSWTNPSGPVQGLRDYETYAPKDIFFLGANDEVAFIVRTGPHQGSYQFHCHNLQHEDDGLMGQFNSTSATKPRIPTTFWQGTLAPERFAGFEKTPDSPMIYKGEDPLVYSVANNTNIGHNLYFADSMPPWAQRKDPNNPTQPQPITPDLLRKVLSRNYYAVYYPDSRSSLAAPAGSNQYAVRCPAQPPK